ncbi:MAG: hypothetical protein EBS61_09635 [Betaproteobacteria bacterium]|nr:hypothetical protein [Betaproteobacteria bacterium]
MTQPEHLLVLILPTQPSNQVILAVGVVVTKLAAPPLIAAVNHQGAQRRIKAAKHRRPLGAPQGMDRIIMTWTLKAMIKSLLKSMTITIILAVAVVMSTRVTE